ncbi:MAG: glycine oxidase ThiO [bacterium]|nr:glycine oxidase ThiO [bacterium]
MTHSLPQSVDCAVIGAGVVGMAAARELTRTGLKTLVIDKGSPGMEASWAGGGILSPLEPWDLNPDAWALAHRSMKMYPALAEALKEETGIDPEWRRCGVLIRDRGMGEHALNWAKHACFQVERVTGGAVRELEPALHSEFTDALWLKDVAQIRNPRLIRALKQSLKQKGAMLADRCEVKSIRTENGRVTGVETSAGAVNTPLVIVAAGAWTPALLMPLDINLAIEPVRGQMLLFQANPGQLTHIVMDQTRYVIPREDGLILAGSTLEHAGFDKRNTEQACEQIRTSAAGMVPFLETRPVIRQWAGLRPGSPQGVPSIGPAPGIEGLYVNAGHFRYGITMAPASARLLMDLIQQNEPEIDPAPYRLS